MRAKKDKKLIGRPPLPCDERRDAVPLYIKLNKLERARLEQKAMGLDITLTEWARKTLLRRC